MGKAFFTFFTLVLLFYFPTTHGVVAQNDSADSCLAEYPKRIRKDFASAEAACRRGNLKSCLSGLNKIVESEPDHPGANYLLGLYYIEERHMNLKAATTFFETVLNSCPEGYPYAAWHLARIAYGKKEFEEAQTLLEYFLSDVDKIESDSDYDEALLMLDYCRFYNRLLSNPVPFNPRPVPGISTPTDEYLPIISPDNELAFFTRRIVVPPRRDDITPQVKYREKFMYSIKSGDRFSEGKPMPAPFNMNENEGGATVTIDNKTLFYTLCRYNKGNTYYNCDICSSKKVNGVWQPVENLGIRVNGESSWESQPTVTADGKTLYFVSDRPGGFGGYDIYKSTRLTDGSWGPAENLGPVINSPGNEKSPFIHTDSQTLYFSSDGWMGLGGYDIFYARRKEDGTWEKPVNIGYPINSFDDDVGFFVSTDGTTGYFASNKFDGPGGWDLYSFNLYEKARPKKVLFLKGRVSADASGSFAHTTIELKDSKTDKITLVDVDTLTGEYVAAVPFRNDFIMTVKRRGYVPETRLISHIDPRYSAPAKLSLDLKKIEVGRSYTMEDIYFAFNSDSLKPESKMVIEAFSEFLADNPTVTVLIEGHTDNIGNERDNLELSERRARSVYNYLIQLGIDPKRLSYKGYGESRPVAGNETEQGRALNRRTAFVITGK
ncbi:MAG: hypothetical protein Kow00127_02490 [Bacteroidales bacterium]